MQSFDLVIRGGTVVTASDAMRADVGISGETIVALSAMAGCKDSKAVGKKLQQNFSQLFPGQKTPVEEVSRKVIEELRADTTLACRNIG